MPGIGTAETKGEQRPLALRITQDQGARVLARLGITPRVLPQGALSEPLQDIAIGTEAQTYDMLLDRLGRLI